MDPLQILRERGQVEASFIDKAAKLVLETGRSHESVFLELGMSSKDVRDFFADYYQVPTFTLPEGFSVPQEILSFIPEESAVHYRSMPLMIEDDVLVVGTSNPDDLQMREALNFISTKFNKPYRLVYMLDAEVTEAQKFYENLVGDVGVALETIDKLEDELDAEIAATGDEEVSGKDSHGVDHIEEDAPVTKIVATILRYAVDGKASDIHIEPNRTKVGVRFRVDGELVKSLELPKNVHMAVVARVKILSSMRLDERRRPQDGRFSANFDDRKIDFRVSVLPTSFGEKVVMRILDNDKGVRNLEETGISKEHLDIIRRVINEPYGIILISGPTGSGKSTTLYGILGELDKASQNVLSLEDPIEYSIEGVSQSQVRPEIGYTFAAGLRAALRQDPDIIMVGEIRDKETAQLAIQAALTGHLVLSTIHTNNAIGVIPRLIDMGVDPYLIAPTLKLAIAQRLARKLFNGEGIEEQVSPSTKMMFDETFKTLPERYHDRKPTGKTFMHPKPTPQSATGLKGRTAVSEVLEVTDEVQELILRNASEEEFFQVARKNGFVTMYEDAIVKALKHEIPYEEMNIFRSKIGREQLETAPETPVDNQFKDFIFEDIIKGDETTTG
ncbi:MAG: GspE/PulE family protein [Patescibacteria group bacterium]